MAENLLAHSFYKSSYSVNGDYSHGTVENAILHKHMMENIANDVVKAALAEW